MDSMNRKSQELVKPPPKKATTGLRRIYSVCMTRILSILIALLVTGCKDSGPTEILSAPSKVDSTGEIPSTPSVFWPLTETVLVGPRPDQNLVETLKNLGVQKVVSVDALPPEASLWGDAIQVRHLPLGYRSISRQDQLRLAQELSKGNGKIYIHCHHGKHRAPAAALTALRSLGQLNPSEANEWLDRCGVAYEGLRTVVAEATAAESHQIESAMPLEVTCPTKTLSRLMAEVDDVWDRLKKVPSPDDPNAQTQPEDASQLVDLLRLASTTAGPVEAEYHQQMKAAVDLANQLEIRVRAGESAAPIRAALRKSCRSCHQSFRD